MPELPEVELFKRHLDATCRSRTIARVSVRDRRILGGISPRTFSARLKGARIGRSRRHGKHLLVDLGKAGWLALHFGMNGSLKHVGKRERDPLYDRVCFDFNGGDHLAYINPRLLGRVRLVETPAAFIAAENLGPDALDPKFHPSAFVAMLAGAKRDLKSVLMDQALCAGIGNIYSDEILFRAGLHPKLRADRIPPAASKRLFRAMKSVLKTAVARHAGSERI